MSSKNPITKVTQREVNFASQADLDRAYAEAVLFYPKKKYIRTKQGPLPIRRGSADIEEAEGILGYKKVDFPYRHKKRR